MLTHVVSFTFVDAEDRHEAKARLEALPPQIDGHRHAHRGARRRRRPGRLAPRPHHHARRRRGPAGLPDPPGARGVRRLGAPPALGQDGRRLRVLGPRSRRTPGGTVVGRRRPARSLGLVQRVGSPGEARHVGRVQLARPAHQLRERQPDVDQRVERHEDGQRLEPRRRQHARRQQDPAQEAQPPVASPRRVGMAHVAPAGPAAQQDVEQRAHEHRLQEQVVEQLREHDAGRAGAPPSPRARP